MGKFIINSMTIIQLIIALIMLYVLLNQYFNLIIL